jgi:hypothetical protein
MIILFLIWYFKIGLIFGVLFTMAMSISKQDILLPDIIGAILLYPIIIYCLITDKY